MFLGLLIIFHYRWREICQSRLYFMQVSSELSKFAWILKNLNSAKFCLKIRKPLIVAQYFEILLKNLHFRLYFRRNFLKPRVRVAPPRTLHATGFQLKNCDGFNSIFIFFVNQEIHWFWQVFELQINLSLVVPAINNPLYAWPGFRAGPLPWGQTVHVCIGLFFCWAGLVQICR